MSTRFALLSLVPLLAAGPSLSSAAADARDPFADPQFMDQLHQAQNYAMRAGQDLAQSLAILRQAIPRYGLPYIDERGNIVIPRVAPAPSQGTPVPDAEPAPL